MTNAQILSSKGHPGYGEEFATKVLALAAEMAEWGGVGLNWMLFAAINRLLNSPIDRTEG